MKPSSAVNLLARPHLITPAAAQDLARRIQLNDQRAFSRPSGPFAFLRKVGLSGSFLDRGAVEDDEGFDAPPPSLKDAALAAAPVWLGEVEDAGAFGWVLKDGIAVLTIDTALAATGEYFCGQWWHGYDTIAAAIEEADADDRVKAIFLRIESPGGVVASGLYDLAEALQERRTQTKAKPLWASCEIACSAAYWIAAQADRVSAPRAGQIGSIGAVMVHEDWSGAYAKAGVKVTSIQFGAHKTDGAHWRALDEAAREDAQAQIDAIGEAFLEAVEIGRNGALPAEAARATEARVFAADHADASRSAIALGLIDTISSEKRAFAALRSEISTHSPADGTVSAQPPGRTAATQEPTMSRQIQARIAALAATEGDNEDFKEKVRRLIDEDDETQAQDEPDETAETDESNPKAEDEDDVTAEDSGEDKEVEDEETKPSARTAQADAQQRIRAILDLPEAKGRDDLAKTLAFDTTVSVKEARARLSNSPRANRLATRMNGQDPKVSGASAPGAKSAASAATRAMKNAGLIS